MVHLYSTETMIVQFQKLQKFQKPLFAVLKNNTIIVFTDLRISLLKVLQTQSSLIFTASCAINLFFSFGNVKLNPGMTGRTNTNERSNTKTPKRSEDNFTIAHLNARSGLSRTGTTSPSSRTSSLRISLTSLLLARLGWILRSKSRVIPSLVLIVQTKLEAACVPL